MVLSAASPAFLKPALASDLLYILLPLTTFRQPKQWSTHYRYVTRNENVQVSDLGDSEELACVHLPDFASSEVGPVLSLLYYGEIW